MTLVETRRMDSSNVRSICIKMDWYTRGTCEEYDKMLSKADGTEATPEKIFELATDIFYHSDMSRYENSGYSDDEIIENVMCYIVNDATFSSIEIKRA